MLPLWGISLCWAGLSHAAPSGAQITAGSGSVTQSGNVTSIQQSSNDLSINWQSFNISSNEVVNFVQPSAGALAINRILGNSPSEIFGHLNANGQVWLINPNGVLFGRGAQVNVGGLIASTLDVADSTLDLDGRTFSGTGTGSIVNDGTLKAAAGGYVALLGNQVTNRGIISAQLGTVALAAGSAETLTFSARQLIHVQVDRSTLHDLADNGQLIEANGGQVIMTAGAKDSLLASAVNNTGIVQAQTVENHGGTITLLAGMQAGEVQVGGTLDASAPAGAAGGAIETSGAVVAVASDAKVLAGPGGSWRIDPTNLTIDAAAATAIETTLNGGASVTEQTTATSASGFGTQSAGLGDIDVDAAISWTNPAATLTLSAYHAINVNAAVSGAGPVVMQAANGNLTIASGASIASNSGVTLGTGANFVNLAGSGALSAGPGARWLVYSTNPTTDTTGGLTPDFIQYAAAFEATPAASGDGLLYSVAPSIAITALGGSVSKTYDGGTAATLTAAGSNYTVSGLLNGDSRRVDERQLSVGGRRQQHQRDLRGERGRSHRHELERRPGLRLCAHRIASHRRHWQHHARAVERGDRRRSDQGVRRHHDRDADLGELQPLGLRRRPERNGQSAELGRLCVGCRRSPGRERHLFQYEFRGRFRYQPLELRPADLGDGRWNGAAGAAGHHRRAGDRQGLRRQHRGRP